MSHVPYMNGSCHTFEWVMSQNMNESCPTYEWLMSHIRMSHGTCEWLSHGTHMNESCQTWMSYVTHMNMPTPTRTCRGQGTHQHAPLRIPALVSSSWVSHVTHMTISCHTPLMERSQVFTYVWRDVFMCVTWHIPAHITHEEEWYIHVCDIKKKNHVTHLTVRAPIGLENKWELNWTEHMNISCRTYVNTNTHLLSTRNTRTGPSSDSCSRSSSKPRATMTAVPPFKRPT